MKKINIFGLVFILLFFIGSSTAVLFVKTQEAEAKTTIVKRVVIGLPLKLKIPKIKVNSTIESVGLTKDGAVDSPVGPANTGWYKLGPRPGEIGSSIIDGHSGWKDGIPAVFDDLYKIKIGDKVYIESQKGIKTTFVVRKIMKYDPSATATDVFVSTDKKVHLNLITCTGTWDSVSRSHSSRLVVFTDKE